MYIDYLNDITTFYICIYSLIFLNFLIIIMINPYKKFKKWFKVVQKKKMEDPTAFALATNDKRNQPHVRMVLLKKVTNDGFIFFTNLNSNKAKHFKKNNKLSMCFYWESINRQIRITGNGKIISNIDADEYFYSRPRGSRIGAWASKQSSSLKCRKDFLDRVKFYEKKFFKKKIPRPNYWTGIKILPREFEFWKQGKFRMHDREFYSLKSKKWEKKLLYP